MPIIVAHILEGRTKEQKRTLIKALTDATSGALNVPPDAVRIVIDEMEKTSYGIGGKTAEELGR